MSAVFICHNINSRFGIPLSIFVSVEKNSRSITVVKISVVYLALQSHLRLLDHFNENVSVFFVHYWKSSFLSENSLRRSRPFTSMRLSVSFRTWAVGRSFIARTWDLKQLPASSSISLLLRTSELRFSTHNYSNSTSQPVPANSRQPSLLCLPETQIPRNHGHQRTSHHNLALHTKRIYQRSNSAPPRSSA